MAFTCHNCEVYQAAYVSQPREEKQESEKKNKRAAYVDTDSESEKVLSFPGDA